MVGAAEEGKAKGPAERPAKAVAAATNGGENSAALTAVGGITPPLAAVAVRKELVVDR